MGHKKNMYTSEPKFIPAGTENDPEDHGCLAFVVLNGPRGASDFVVLNATTFDEIAVVELPVHIPFLGHAQFIPSAEQKAAIKEAASSSPHPDVGPVLDNFLLI